ncbi:MAG: hypothetical protein AUH78_14715 [Gemmatimonadetes bacterium 13_1_40CM_4_69_8]|nr:MAG: hypothetical protein AUH78_14715 [Gemmatimonadetes bacterium 13_1_40CM_4_69_8]
MKPPTALAHKGVAVEEWVDLRFYRPLGVRLARALQPSSVSADEVTLWALMVGLVGGHLFVYVDWRRNALGFALLIVSDVLDSADGQLARLRGTSTRFGRTLDGIGDNLRGINIYVHLVIRLFLAGSGWAALLLGAMAALSHSLQSAAVDFIRNAYLFATARAGELDLPEDFSDAPPPSPSMSGGGLARFAARVYRDYVGRQARLLPRTVRLIRSLRRAPIADAFRAEYQELQGPLLPVCAWLGQNIRFALVGVTAIAGHPAVYLWAEASVMNVVFLVLVLRHEGNATALRESLGEAESVYA